MENNHTVISQGFRYLLEALAPYIARELEIEYGEKLVADCRAG